MAQVKERGRGGEERRETLAFRSFPSPSLLYHFFALTSFLARPFLGLLLLRNQTETLATQATKLAVILRSSRGFCHEETKVTMR